jgi:hypothetical protein
MNTAHLHLLLNHIPILGAFFGIVLLSVGLPERTLLYFPYPYGHPLGGCCQSGAFFTGKVRRNCRKFSGVSEAAIEAHEDASALPFMHDALGD